jgi:hypothetical protein
MIIVVDLKGFITDADSKYHCSRLAIFLYGSDSAYPYPEQRILLQIRILLISTVAFKIKKKIHFFS